MIIIAKSYLINAEKVVKGMETRDFCYWLQGFFELDGQDGLTEAQVSKIKKKLNSCFEHEVKPIPTPAPAPQWSQRPSPSNRRVKC